MNARKYISTPVTWSRRSAFSSPRRCPCRCRAHGAAAAHALAPHFLSSPMASCSCRRRDSDCLPSRASFRLLSVMPRDSCQNMLCVHTLPPLSTTFCRHTWSSSVADVGARPGAMTRRRGGLVVCCVRPQHSRGQLERALEQRRAESQR
jgi:hypothetical protein